MDEQLPTILDQALARLKAGEPIDVILSDYAAQSDELAPLLDAALEFLSLRNVPQPRKSETELAAFLDQAEALRADMGLGDRFRRWLAEGFEVLRELWWRPQTRLIAGIAAALILLLVLLISMFTMAADSLPGDWLYPVKLVGEEVRLAFTTDPAARVEYHLRRVHIRTKEIERLAQAGHPISDRTLARLRESLQDSLLDAAWAEAVETAYALSTIKQTTDEQAALIEAIENATADPAARGSLFQVRVSLLQAHAAARTGLADLYTFRLNARLGIFSIYWLSPLPLEQTEPPITPVP